MALLSQMAGAQPVADEMIVTAQKVNAITLALGRDADDHVTCGVSRSSGDPRIDERMCRSAAKCVKRGPVDQTALDACIAKKKPALVAEIAKAERSTRGRPAF